MFSMTKIILDKVDEKIKEIATDENAKHANLKLFGLGMIEGAIDGAVIMYPIMVGSLYWAAYKERKSKI